MNAYNPFNDRRYAWEWLSGIGVMAILFGVIALLAPVYVSLSLAWLLGALFFVSGVVQLIHASRFSDHPGSASRFLLAAFSMVAGTFMMRSPAGGSMGITIALAVYLILGALAKFTLAAELKPHVSAGWMAISAGVSFFLGAFLLVTFPVNYLYAPALIFGVDMILFGSTLMAAVWSYGKALPKLETKSENSDFGKAA